MESYLVQQVNVALALGETLREGSSISFMMRAKEMIASAFQNGNKLLIAGNGGSLCDAIHFAEELTGYFREKRRALPAIALSDPGHMSCVANDVGYERVFSRAVEALGVPGDIFIALTTSGNSKNLVEAQRVAKERGLLTISFLGKNGGLMAGCADLELIVPGVTSDRIQEVHMTAIHLIIDLVERQLFDCAYQEELVAAND